MRIGFTLARLAGVCAAATLLLTSPGSSRAADPLVVEAAAARSSGSPQTWHADMFEASMIRLQNPDASACTAASVMSMLNLIAMETDEIIPGRGGLPKVDILWQVSKDYARQEEILRWERKHMTMLYSSPGSDLHGWRNALNQFGWGDINADVYRDVPYGTFDEAARATVVAIARTHKPVGIPGWFGGHAQYVTGYDVRGQDPAVGDNFIIDAIYLSDPLQGDSTSDARIAYDQWKKGPAYLRFGAYAQTDSPFVDPLGGTKSAWREWYGKYVLVQPVK